MASRSRTPSIDVRWNLRAVMAQKGLFATSDLVPLLASRGVVLSREQVYRLVTKTPQRLSLVTLGALCDIFECSPNELWRRSAPREHGSHRRKVGEPAGEVMPAVRFAHPRRRRVSHL
jgi:DNA-binding Xre family transcriptional regulator